MWAFGVAALVSVACVAAAARRLVFLLDASAFDPDLLLNALRGDAGQRLVGPLVDAMVKEGHVADESDLLVAIRSNADPGMLSEHLLELDYRFERWARVPRVCASIASSTGLLFATWAMRAALGSAPALGDEAFNGAVEAAIGQALAVVGVGAVGTIACIAVVYEARRLGRARRSAFDQLTRRLEVLLALPG
ncbi:MAG: hypothetical protein IPG50_01805 [Myxococcales bacterium]|nr:hypothetical protein [Myxococcales bacterium]